MLELDSVQLASIPDRIKDTVLGWACALEVAGVNGEGHTFTTQEKQIAHHTTFNIYDSSIEQLNNMGDNNKG